MLYHKIVTYTFFIVCFQSTKVYSALSEKESDDMIGALRDAFEDCVNEFEIISSEVEKMYTDQDYKYDPFFVNCFFTKYGMMDEGIFDVEKFMALTKIYVQREDELARLFKIRQKCLKVNEAGVSDGEDGYAERAMLLYECLKENGDDFVLVQEKYRDS